MYTYNAYGSKIECARWRDYTQSQCREIVDIQRQETAERKNKERKKERERERERKIERKEEVDESQRY